MRIFYKKKKKKNRPGKQGQIFCRDNLDPSSLQIFISGMQILYSEHAMVRTVVEGLSNSYTMDCPPVRGDNP